MQSDATVAESLKKAYHEAGELRMENVALKMKVSHMKKKIDQPLHNPEVVRILSGLHARVKGAI